MENIDTALHISLIAQRRLVVQCSDEARLVQLILDHILEPSNLKYHVIDLTEIASIDELIPSLSKYNVIIWKGIQLVSLAFQKELYNFFMQLDQYDLLNKKKNCEPICINETNIKLPLTFTIMITMLHKYYKTHKLYPLLKEKFWFLINFVEFEEPMEHQNFEPFINVPHKKLRLEAEKIYIAPIIQQYIYSLVVFSRTHRLCSLSPRTTRLPTTAITNLHLLSRTVVAYNNYSMSRDKLSANKTPLNYVSGDVAKVVFRQVASWLIDWEYNTPFATLKPEINNDHKRQNDHYITKRGSNSSDHEDFSHDDVLAIESSELSMLGHRDFMKLEIATLTGNWYGSEWQFVRSYIVTAQSKLEKDSPTGFTNMIVDETLRAVRPPL